MELRWYQKEAIEKTYDYLGSHTDNPVIVLPTGAGKTPVIATLCRDTVGNQGRVLTLAHTKELLEQTADKLNIIAPEIDCGVYSAGLNSRDKSNACIVAGIQSVFRRADELGPFDLILVDECHLIPTDGEGMYRQFLRDAAIVNPDVRVVGLTATPYRLKGGNICKKGHFLNAISYEADIVRLINEGYLCRLVTRSGQASTSTDGLHVRGGEFIASEMEERMNDDKTVEDAAAELVSLTEDCHSSLIFACGVMHAMHIASVLDGQHGIECGFVCGDTPSNERAEIIERFKAGDLGYLVNVNVLTTGFDAQNVDCVALFRPTMSPGLYYQMVGRGLRIHPGKANCLILDFADNIKLHGAIDKIVEPEDKKTDDSKSDSDTPTKECPKCNNQVSLSFRCCPECGHFFKDIAIAKHGTHAGNKAVISGGTINIRMKEPCGGCGHEFGNVNPGDKTDDVICSSCGELQYSTPNRTQLDVMDVLYFLHRKKKQPDAPPTMRVEYVISSVRTVREWVCFEHEGFAKRRAHEWWKARSPDPVPETVERALQLAEAGAIRWTNKITVKPDGEFERIVDYELGDMPEAVSFAGMTEVADDWMDDLPF